MRRADRLFRLVEALRRRRSATAAQLAEELEVARRTVYRDVADLAASGVPIRGEAGVGYILEPGFDLPPVTLTTDEAEALAFAARLLSVWSDESLASPAMGALAKLRDVLPDPSAKASDRRILLAPRTVRRARPAVPLLRLKQAIENRQVLLLAYRDENERVTERAVRPLALVCFGSVWLLLAWCELREAFRNFRVDRLEGARPAERRFQDERGRTVRDYLRQEGLAWSGLA